MQYTHIVPIRVDNVCYNIVHYYKFVKIKHHVVLVIEKMAINLFRI